MSSPDQPTRPTSASGARTTPSNNSNRGGRQPRKGSLGGGSERLPVHPSRGGAPTQASSTSRGAAQPTRGAHQKVHPTLPSHLDIRSPSTHRPAPTLEQLNPPPRHRQVPLQKERRSYSHSSATYETRRPRNHRQLNPPRLAQNLLFTTRTVIESRIRPAKVRSYRLSRSLHPLKVSTRKLAAFNRADWDRWQRCRTRSS